MPAETFDAVIVGGGTKALFLATYLVKYAGMSVGIFERSFKTKGVSAYRAHLPPSFILPHVFKIQGYVDKETAE